MAGFFDDHLDNQRQAKPQPAVKLPRSKYDPKYVIADCREHLKGIEKNKFHACMTDPPYELGFMGKGWDRQGVSFRPETWVAVLKALRPGAHLLAFGGTRTAHRIACAIEDAGFEIRDTIYWAYGSGFPKSHDVSKGIDKALGAVGEYGEHKSEAHKRTWNNVGNGGWQRPWKDDAAANDRYSRKYTGGSEEARQWQGWGTALKPAIEPCILARKPLSEGTVAANVLKHGTGAINVDGCNVIGGSDAGRWPANLIHDGSDEVVAAFPETSSGALRAEVQRGSFGQNGVYGKAQRDGDGRSYAADTGSAARFFYAAKADKSERAGSKHPTVKPLSLIRYLVRLITPPGGIVLDPFAGSGTTGEAALLEGMSPYLIEQDESYARDIQRRFDRAWR